MVDRAIAEHLYSGSDVTFMENMPFGTAKEIISISTIKAIVENASIVKNTEYLEYYLMNEKVFNVGYIESPYGAIGNARITLDYKEDLEFFDVIFKYFDENKEDFDLIDVIKYLDENPEINLINANRQQKYSSHEVDTSLAI
jgi:spore coat polysaccharide biosynthesis protein SpsF (cytidylyltransferase family)